MCFDIYRHGVCLRRLVAYLATGARQMRQSGQHEQ